MNRRIEVLQTSALPLGYRALKIDAEIGSKTAGGQELIFRRASGRKPACFYRPGRAIALMRAVPLAWRRDREREPPPADRIGLIDRAHSCLRVVSRRLGYSSNTLFYSLIPLESSNSLDTV